MSDHDEGAPQQPQGDAEPPENRGFGAVREGLDDNARGKRKTGSLLARALVNGWVKDDDRAEAVDGCRYLMRAGKSAGDGQLVNFGVRGMLAAEANDLKRMEMEDKAARLDAGDPTDIGLQIVIEEDRGPAA